MLWKIYYSDGSVFSNETGSPEEAPSLGVQVIVVADKDHGRWIVTGGNPIGRDYFWWTDDGWYCGDYIGLIDYLSTPGWKKVLFGRTIPTSEFQSIYRKAKEDKDFPLKTGWRRDETRLE